MSIFYLIVKTSENHQFKLCMTVFFFNPFHAIGLILYPLKTSENQRFSDVFREYRTDQWHRIGQ